MVAKSGFAVATRLRGRSAIRKVQITTRKMYTALHGLVRISLGIVATAATHFTIKTVVGHIVASSLVTRLDSSISSI